MRTTITAAALLAVMLWTAPALAQPDNPDDYRIEQIGEYPVTPGTVCQLVTANNRSVHTGNILFWEAAPTGRAGTQTGYVEGIEDVAGQSTTVEIQTDSADVVRVYVLVYLPVPDPITSLDATVTCPPPPTTSTPPTTTPPPPSTTPPPTPTTHPDTGGTEPSTILYGLALAAVAYGLTRTARPAR